MEIASNGGCFTYYSWDGMQSNGTFWHSGDLAIGDNKNNIVDRNRVFDFDSDGKNYSLWGDYPE